MAKLSPGDKEKQVLKVINYLVIDRLHPGQIAYKEHISKSTVFRIIEKHDLKPLIKNAWECPIKNYREHMKKALALVAEMPNES